MKALYIQKMIKSRIFIQWFIPLMIYLFLFGFLWFIYIKVLSPAMTQVHSAPPQLAFVDNTFQKITELGKMNVFGKSVLQMEVKKTLQGFKIVGIFYEKNGKSSVVLSANNKENEYQEGDKLNSVFLIKKIEEDRIIMDTPEGEAILELFIED